MLTIPHLVAVQVPVELAVKATRHIPGIPLAMFTDFPGEECAVFWTTCHHSSSHPSPKSIERLRAAGGAIRTDTLALLGEGRWLGAEVMGRNPASLPLVVGAIVSELNGDTLLARIKARYQR